MDLIESNECQESLGIMGHKQWEILTALAKDFEKADMKKISATSNFNDRVWSIEDDSLYDFKWAKWFPNEDEFPLMLVCKVTCYYHLQVNNLAISTVQRTVASFANAFRDIFKAKNILIAERNRPFNALSQLTPSDISLVAQSHIALRGTLSVSPFRFLNRINAVQSDSWGHFSFLISGLITPWYEQSIDVNEWIKKLKQLHGSDTSLKPYSPLDFDTVSKIVQKALPFIEEHYDVLSDLFKDVENLQKANSKNKLSVKARKYLANKYYEQLSCIIDIQLDTNGAISAGSLKKLEYHIQGAASWIIQLTTGLRNVDMRNLETGCCQPSKRYDLLNYLVSDIRKVHLKNYVIPVPSQTLKAVLLLERCKRFLEAKKSRFLLTTSLAYPRDKNVEAANRYKIRDGGTYNRLLRAFANHYKITLTTLSESDNEASSHCIRATLAGWVGTHSVAAILLLKKLFGHSNALMPDAYLAHNPLIIAERNKHIEDGIKQIAEDLADAISRGKISGQAGKRLVKGAENIREQLDRAQDCNDSSEKSFPNSKTSTRSSGSLAFKPCQITEMDMRVRLKERFKELFLSRIKERQIYALKTPMSVVCMRNTNNTNDAPCIIASNHLMRREVAVSKIVTDTLGTPPCPANCVGANCADALFGDTWSRDLLVTFDYYIRYLQGVGYQTIDVKSEAKQFKETYGPILKDLYEDEREQGYFD